MAQKTRQYLGLDVGTVRIGMAVADDAVRIAIPQGFVAVDGTEVRQIAEEIVRGDIHTVVIGYPRNQSGDRTAQTEVSEAFAEKLHTIAPRIVFQDESLTSVMAEQRLQSRKVKYEKGDIDAEAAAIILQDYMEQHA